MTSKLYCVYLTTYFGNKLPMFYIGHTSVKNIQNGYRGSVASRKYKALWKQELFNNPHLFKTQILCEFVTKRDAAKKESLLQHKLNVVPNPMYVNMSDGVHVPENLHNGSGTRGKKRCKDTRNGKIVFIEESRLKEYHVPDDSKNDMVSAYDTVKHMVVSVSSEEFYSNDNLVGVMSGKLYVTLKETGECVCISCTEYDRNIHEHSNNNMVGVIDKIDGSSKQVTSKEYHTNKERYHHTSNDKTIVLDVISGKFCSITLHEYYSNQNKYLNAGAAYLTYKNTKTNDIVTILASEVEKRHVIESSAEYIRMLRITANGKKWYTNNDTGETCQFFEGTQPDGWIKKRRYNRKQDCLWFKNSDNTKELYCTLEECPEGWTRGRKKQTTPRKKPAKKIWMHNPTTGESQQIDPETEIPEGWLRGNGKKMSEESKKKRSIASRDRIWIHDAVTEEERMIKPDQPIPEGWVKGSISMERRRDPKNGRFSSTNYK